MILKMHWTVWLAVALTVLVILAAPYALPDSWPFAYLIAIACTTAYILLLTALGRGGLQP